MAASDDEPLHLYEVFQNCFNKIANKQGALHFTRSHQLFQISSLWIIISQLGYSLQIRYKQTRF